MKYLLSAFVLISTCNGFAATKTVKLDMKLTLNGRHVSSPVVIVPMGEKAKIEQGKTEINGDNPIYIEVIATEDKPEAGEGIQMKFVVGQIINGEQKILMQPKVVALEGGEAEVSMTTSDEKSTEVKLSVIPTINEKL